MLHRGQVRFTACLIYLLQGHQVEGDYLPWRFSHLLLIFLPVNYNDGKKEQKDVQ